MLYNFSFMVPADTAELDPVITELKLGAGIIHRIEVEFRYGPSFMVFVKILRGGFQLFPINRDSSLRGDGTIIGSDEYEELTEDDNTLKVVAYSPGTQYDHQIIVRVGILPPDVVGPLSGIGGALKKFLALIGVGS